MCIERNRNLEAERIVYKHAGYAKIDQVDPGTKLYCQVGCPILRIRIIGPNAESVGCPDCDVGELAPCCMICAIKVTIRRLAARQFATADKKEYEERKPCKREPGTPHLDSR